MKTLIKNWAKNLFVETTGLVITRKGGRCITVKEDDIFIVSYPKSGNTWVRFLIGNLLNPLEPMTFINMEEKVPDIYANSDHKLLSLPSPRILKSHECFDPQYKKVIYIVREPRSVAVSYYHHCIKFRVIPYDMKFSQFLKIFAQGNVDSFGTWAENVLSWVETIGNDKNRFLLLRYEDIKSDTIKSLMNVAEFMGMEKNSKTIERAVKLSSFDRMKKLEIEQAVNTEVLKKTDFSRAFIRKGDVKEWKEYFNKNSSELLCSKFDKAMKKLGYDHE